MSSADRGKSIRVRTSRPFFDHLEARSMLNATPVTHVAVHKLIVNEYHKLIPHAQVAKTTHVSKPAHVVAKKPAHAVAKVATPAALGSGAVGLKNMPLAHQVLLPREIQHQAAGADLASPLPGVLTPPQVRLAYGINLLANQGAGTTIGIVDVFDDPNIASDLAAFSTQYGLPQMNGVGGNPTFTKVMQTGTPTSPNNGGSTDTSTETALDVEWAHAMAPLANIVLAEVKSFSYSDGAGGGLLPGVQALVATPGVTAISVSYGGGEFSGETAADSFFTTPFGANPNPVAITFSTGDNGFPSFPATSSSVLAVGGTGLYIASARGRYGFETAWGGLSGFGAGGGGVSTQYATPTFQSTNGVNFGHRSIPDVSAIADPLTSVTVYNSWDAGINNGSSWFGVGGTSLASPVVAGIVDLAQELRLNAGLKPLSSPQINARLYAAYNSAQYLTYFHDITVGNNNDVGGTAGFSAVTGYDRATGIGSPIGNSFVMLLAATP
jgi:subtilase family serine protease